MSWLDGIIDLMDRGSEQTQRDGEGQGGLACCSPRGHKELGSAEQLNSANNKGRPGGGASLGGESTLTVGREGLAGSSAGVQMPTLSTRARVFPLLAPLSHL